MSKMQRKYSLNVETSDGEIITIKDPLTLEFSVSRNILASANTGEFRIYNLGSLTRNRIYKSKYHTDVFRRVELRAGYDEEPPVIFTGNILEAMSFKEERSVNYYTDISGYDGGFDMVNSFSSFALAAGATKQQVIDRLVKDLSNTEKGKFSDFEGSHSRGRSVLGNTLKIISKETDNSAYIDNGVINALLDNDCILGDIEEISSQTGLLGSPKRADTNLIVDMIFEPRIKVGQIVKLNSQTEKNFNGTYKVIGITHTGTISGAVGGKCATEVSLYYGTDVLREI